MPNRRFPLNKFLELLKNPPLDVDIMLYDKKKRGFNPGGDTMNNSNKGKVTLSKLAGTVDNLAIIVNQLTEEMRDGFAELRHDIKDINARLDYNGLKKLPIDK